MDRQKQTVKEFMRRHIILFVVLMLICILFNNIATTFVTAPFEDSVTVSHLLLALCKYTMALIPLFLMVRWGFVQKSGVRSVLAGLLLGIPSVLLIAGNLLPFALISPASYKVQWLPVLAIVFAYFGVGLMEEAACRGVLLPLLYEKWAGRENGRMKAALVSSALFGCAHLGWIVNALVFTGTVSVVECLGRLYQVYYAFCFGMLCAGVTLCVKSMIPVMIWHSLIDISAAIGQGILYPSTYQYYFELNPVGLDTVLMQKGIVQDAGILSWALPIGVDALLLIVGIILVRRSGRRADTVPDRTA